MKKTYLILAIIILASFLRLWQLGKVPPSPDWDEVALGYNAYSMMQTGKDEYGKFLPLVLRSFDDYKPALYAYLTIPSVAILGLNTFAVRLPSAIFGILTVVATYFLAKELFMDISPPRCLPAEGGAPPPRRCFLPLIAAFLLAISPWHLQFSRVAFEVNVALAFNVFGVLFFLKGLRKPFLLIFSAILFGLGLYLYQGQKIFIPLIALALVIIFRKELFAITKRYLLLALLTGFLISLPLLFYTFTDPQALTRARGVSAFADQTSFLQRSAQKLLHDRETGDFLGLVLDNRRIQYPLAAFSGYLSHFDPNWLFIKGDEARHHAPFMGLLYLWELPFLLLGIYGLLFGPSADGFSRKAKILIFSWFLLAPIPAAVTSGVPHAVRTLNFLPTFQIFTALGIINAFFMIKYMRRLYFRFSILTFTFSFLIFNFLYYLNQYFVQQNYFNSQDWQYGYRQAVEEIKKIEVKYEKIVVTNRPHLDQSYIFFLFYLKYDPPAYQKEGGTVSGGFAQPHRGFGKYTFRPIEWEKEEKNPQILYVGRPSDFPDNARVIKTINFLDGQPAIKIVEG